MVKKIFFTVLLSFSGFMAAKAQSDSTDLNFYATDVVLVTELDSMLYDPTFYNQLNLAFTISDSALFGKVHIELTNGTTGELIFRKSYTAENLTADGLIEDWDVNIPFGNLMNSESYLVSAIIEDYSGALGPTILKTLNP